MAADPTQIEPSKQFEYSFLHALEEGYTAVMESLLRIHKVPLPENVHELAARSKNAPAVLAFLREWSGVNMGPRQLNESLKSAVRSGDVEGAALLLKWGADPTSSALIYTTAAAEKCNPLVMSLLLEAKADPTAHNRQGEAALFPLIENYYAYYDEYPSELARIRFQRAHACLRLLLQQPGVSSNAKRWGTGPTALETAMRSGWSSTAMTLLLQAGAVPDLTALSEAINRSHSRCVEAFMEQESGAAAFGAAAEELLRKAFSKHDISMVATMLRYCPASALSYDAFGQLHRQYRFSFDCRSYDGAEVLHTALLYHHRSFPEQPPLPGIGGYAAGLCRSYGEVEEEERWSPNRGRLMDWHHRCPNGLDEAARRLLAAVGAPIEQMEVWLARFRSSLFAALNRALPPPLQLMVSLYTS